MTDRLVGCCVEIAQNFYCPTRRTIIVCVWSLSGGQSIVDATGGRRGRVAGRYFDELEVGERFTTVGRTVTETDIVQFLNLSRNLEPQFSNREFYEKSWIYGK